VLQIDLGRHHSLAGYRLAFLLLGNSCFKAVPLLLASAWQDSLIDAFEGDLHQSGM
jgi:hypothetical protein